MQMDRLWNIDTEEQKKKKNEKSELMFFISDFQLCFLVTRIAQCGTACN